MSAVESTLWAIFVVSGFLCLWVYIGYPLLMALLARIRPRPVDAHSTAQPTVTVLIPAYNEAQLIQRKLDNTLAADYPGERLEVLVVSDGSTDGTDEIVGEYAGRQPPGASVRLLSLSRTGKVGALNAGVAEASGEILVLTDANAWWSPSTLQRLTAAFTDPAVGGVCGNKLYAEAYGSDATVVGENLYWRFDKWLKGRESRVGSIFAADGTLYAIRRSLFVPVVDPAQADDIAISARVVLQGFRLLYEPRAVVYERPPLSGSAEFSRKVRVTNHSLRALWNLGSDLWTAGFYSLELLSHKFLRHLLAFPLLTLLASHVALVLLEAPGDHLLGALLAPHLLCYALSGLGWLLRDRPIGRRRLLSVPYYFVYVNAAALAGALSILIGRRYQTWTPRGGAATNGGS